MCKHKGPEQQIEPSFPGAFPFEGDKASEAWPAKFPLIICVKSDDTH